MTNPLCDGDEMVESTESRIRALQDDSTYEIVCVCGSMRFHNEMLLTAEQLTLQGCIVLLPLVRKTKDMIELSAKQQQEIEQSLPDGVNLHIFLDAMHRRKIDMAHHVVVVTNRANYIGDSTKAEIAYAIERGIDIVFDKYSVSTVREPS